jgi:DNA-binding MarR family transcriptional regulator
MIERLPDAEDRRSFSLSVSPEGRAYLGELRSRKSAYLARELEGLSDQELLILSQAADILGRLNDERCGMDSR